MSIKVSLEHVGQLIDMYSWFPREGFNNCTYLLLESRHYYLRVRNFVKNGGCGWNCSKLDED